MIKTNQVSDIGTGSVNSGISYRFKVLLTNLTENDLAIIKHYATEYDKAYAIINPIEEKYHIFRMPWYASKERKLAYQRQKEIDTAPLYNIAQGMMKSIDGELSVKVPGGLSVRMIGEMWGECDLIIPVICKEDIGSPIMK